MRGGGGRGRGLLWEGLILFCWYKICYKGGGGAVTGYADFCEIFYEFGEVGICWAILLLNWLRSFASSSVYRLIKGLVMNYFVPKRGGNLVFL